jgi:hypothetical protein
MTGARHGGRRLPQEWLGCPAAAHRREPRLGVTE